mmetsp:Transcript_11169/g.29757  ORF Transcript_11169/g.29757 Transcript_11169/m.29757 type:complete len:167 (+) Transcript_11169:59-559(+)
MQIFIKLERTITLEVEAADPVESVRRKIGDRLSIPADCFSLQYAGKSLEDGRLLSDYHVQNHATLFSRLRIDSDFPLHPPRKRARTDGLGEACDRYASEKMSMMALDSVDAATYPGAHAAVHDERCHRRLAAVASAGHPPPWSERPRAPTVAAAWGWSGRCGQLLK